MVSTVIKNWDNNTWLSSNDYIRAFNIFLTKNAKLSSKSRILDIGCGRGKIIGTLSSKLKLKNKPIGIDIVNHKDRDKRFNFKKINASIFYSKNKKKFDLILIKQTIHLLSIYEIKKVLSLSKKNLSPNGKILIFTLNTNNNKIPTFELMKNKLIKSLKRDKKILNLIIKLHPNKIIKKFIYKVRISKKKYLKMIQKRYISILLPLSLKELSNGIKQIDLKFNKLLRFNDNLICIIIKN